MNGPRRILLVHNRYQQAGGEDVVYAQERELLTHNQQRVFEYVADNAEIEGLGPAGKASLAVGTAWSRRSARAIEEQIGQIRPDVVHFHNTFPLISPAAYYACQRKRVPVVQTLHNFRLLCPNALLFRDGAICEECVGKLFPWPAVQHRCYRGSASATAVTAAMLFTHSLLGTWTEKVDVYIALTEFARQKFIAGGLPADKIVVKPNFLAADPGTGDGAGRYALFVGRLSPEKGVDTLLEAWRLLDGRIPLKIVGDGPLSPLVVDALQRIPDIEWLGRRPASEVLALMQNAHFLILPSKVYENFPVTIAEAYGTGLPVIASDHGAMAELVDHGRIGLRFRVGDAADLAHWAEWAWSHDAELRKMRGEARADFVQKYTAAANYERLMSIYTLARENAAKGRG